jgi:hypothetical protein
MKFRDRPLRREAIALLLWSLIWVVFLIAYVLGNCPSGLPVEEESIEDGEIPNHMRLDAMFV